MAVAFRSALEAATECAMALEIVEPECSVGEPVEAADMSAWKSERCCAMISGRGGVTHCRVTRNPG